MCTAVGLTLAGIYVGLASEEWFFGEDFWFLRHAREQRDWWSVFFPFEERQHLGEGVEVVAEEILAEYLAPRDEAPDDAVGARRS